MRTKKKTVERRLLVRKRRCECVNCGTLINVRAQSTHIPELLDIRMTCHKCKYSVSNQFGFSPHVPAQVLISALDDVLEEFYTAHKIKHVDVSEFEKKFAVIQ